jgi:monoamine oxidase
VGGRGGKSHQSWCRNTLSAIHFDPPLDKTRQEAAEKGHLCKVTKFHMVLNSIEPAFFSSADARSGSPYCFAFSDHQGTKTSGPDGTYAIGFGYSGSERLSDHRNHQEVLSQFEHNMKPGADVRAYLTHDWAADPLSKGSWSCWGPGCASKYLGALQKRHGRVFMASADWANGYRGFVDGAIEQGLLAARSMRQDLGQQSILLGKL